MVLTSEGPKLPIVRFADEVMSKHTQHRVRLYPYFGCNALHKGYDFAWFNHQNTILVIFTEFSHNVPHSHSLDLIIANVYGLGRPLHY